MWKTEYQDVPCVTCGGSGIVDEPQQYDSNGYPAPVVSNTCSDCHGQGYCVRTLQHWVEVANA